MRGEDIRAAESEEQRMRRWEDEKMGYWLLDRGFLFLLPFTFSIHYSLSTIHCFYRVY